MRAADLQPGTFIQLRLRDTGSEVWRVESVGPCITEPDPSDEYIEVSLTAMTLAHGLRSTHVATTALYPRNNLVQTLTREQARERLALTA